MVYSVMKSTTEQYWTTQLWAAFIVIVVLNCSIHFMFNSQFKGQHTGQ